jgi:hypothetical protein
MSEKPSDTRVFRLLGFASLGLYVAFGAFFWTRTLRSQWIDDLVIIFMGGALVVLYFSGVKFAAHSATSVILAFAAGIGVIGFLTVPFDSTDVFFYMAKGWEQAHYGGNPYSVMLRDIDGAFHDPMINNAWMARNQNPWLDIPMPYGFLFALVSRAIAWLGGGKFWVTLALFNFLNLLMHAGTALFLWKASKLLPGNNAKVMLYLYSWNPFVVLQYLVDVHNDIIVGFLVVMAAYLLLKDRPFWTLPLIVAAGLIKYVAFVLTPFALVFLIRRKGWKDGVGAVLLSAAIICAAAAPYVRELASFKYHLIWVQLFESTGSLHTFMMYSFRALGRVWPLLANSLSSFGAVTQATLWLMFAIFTARELSVSWKQPVLEPFMMIQRWTTILFVLIFVASSQFYAWYIGMMFPLAILTRGTTLVADCVIALSGAHMLSFTYLRRRAIGYFLVATLLPVVYLLMQRRRIVLTGAQPLSDRHQRRRSRSWGNLHWGVHAEATKNFWKGVAERALRSKRRG